MLTSCLKVSDKKDSGAQLVLPKPQNEKTKIPRLRKLPKILHQKNPGFGVDIEVPIRIDLYSIFEKVESEKVSQVVEIPTPCRIDSRIAQQSTMSEQQH